MNEGPPMSDEILDGMNRWEPGMLDTGTLERILTALTYPYTVNGERSMPLLNQIERNETLLSLRWGWWHVDCMCKAAEAEGHNLMREGVVTLEKPHRFVDPADGEVLELQPGDILRCHR